MIEKQVDQGGFQGSCPKTLEDGNVVMAFYRDGEQGYEGAGGDVILGTGVSE